MVATYNNVRGDDHTASGNAAISCMIGNGAPDTPHHATWEGVQEELKLQAVNGRNK